jgi:hypothetical protein
VSEPSFSGLITKLGGDLRTLIRQEVTLARVEVTDNLSRAGRAVSWLAVAAFVGLAALHAMLAAAALGLMSFGLEPWLSVSLVAAGALLVGARGGALGWGRGRPARQGPVATVESIKDSAAALMEAVK